MSDLYLSTSGTPLLDLVARLGAQDPASLLATMEGLPREVIVGADGSPYLTRGTLQDGGAEGGRVYLHRFHRGDEDAELHNHPWGARCVILHGGYREERWEGGGVVRYDRRPGDLVVLEPDTFHRVDLLEAECWTVCVTGPVVQSWSFWSPPDGPRVPWREFIRAKGLRPRGE